MLIGKKQKRLSNEKWEELDRVIVRFVILCNKRYK